MTDQPNTTDPPPRKVVKVTRAQVAAARGKIITDRRQGRTTPAWVYKVAAARPAGEGDRELRHP